MSSNDGASGFTLIEATAAMLIMALVASLVITLPFGTGRAKLESVTLTAADLLRRERLGAILSRRTREVGLELDRGALIGGGGRGVRFPPDVAVEMLGTRSLQPGPVSVIRFLPDGSSSGGVMRLSREGARYEIRVDWLTGGVSVGMP